MNEKPAIMDRKGRFNRRPICAEELPLSWLVTDDHLDLTVRHGFIFGKGSQIAIGQVNGGAADGEA